MPWFYCSVCCDTVKKPKIAAHARGCPGAQYTCIDCSLTFSLQDVQGHTSCVTEEQKYAGGATKPGGFAANGFVGAKPPQSTSDVVGSEYLSNGPRWSCSICKVECTSQATLLSHAMGQKHQRRCRAAAAAQDAPSDKAPEADVCPKCDAQTTVDGTGEDKDSKTKIKRKHHVGEDTSTGKKRRRTAASDTVDISQLVMQALSKRGGTAKLQKLLSMVMKKLAKHDNASVDKDSALAKVLAVDGTGFEIVVRTAEEQ